MKTEKTLPTGIYDDILHWKALSITLFRIDKSFANAFQVLELVMTSGAWEQNTISLITTMFDLPSMHITRALGPYYGDTHTCSLHPARQANIPCGFIPYYVHIL